jgi:hypothetical protein
LAGSSYPSDVVVVVVLSGRYGSMADASFCGVIDWSQT